MLNRFMILLLILTFTTVTVLASSVYPSHLQDFFRITISGSNTQCIITPELFDKIYLTPIWTTVESIVIPSTDFSISDELFVRGLLEDHIHHNTV